MHGPNQVTRSPFPSFSGTQPLICAVYCSLLLQQRDEEETPRSGPRISAANDSYRRHKSLALLRSSPTLVLPVWLQVSYVLSLAHGHRGRATQRND